MKKALLQFATSKNQKDNHEKIKNAVIEAADNGARLIITQECALSGYPPIEIDSVNDIDFAAQEKAVKEIAAVAAHKNIYVLLGLIRKDSDKLKNSIMIISPTGDTEYYDKRALWGWDKDNYLPGDNAGGIFEIDDLKIGVRLCFEVRFPEYFRELYTNNADIAVVCFCDVAEKPDPYRLNMIRSHLLTRAVENAFTVMSVNSATGCQTAPTCVINPDGIILAEAEPDREMILYFEYQKDEVNFGRQGRVYYSDMLTE